MKKTECCSPRSADVSQLPWRAARHRIKRHEEVALVLQFPSEGFVVSTPFSLSLSLSFSYESIGLSSLSSRPRRLSVNCVWWRCLSVAFNRSFSKHTFFLGVPQRNGSERKCLKVESGDRRIWGNNLFRTYKNNSFLRRHKYRRWNAPSPIFSSNLPLFKNRRPLKFEKRTRDV